VHSFYLAPSKRAITVLFKQYIIAIIIAINTHIIPSIVDELWVGVDHSSIVFPVKLTAPRRRGVLVHEFLKCRRLQLLPIVVVIIWYVAGEERARLAADNLQAEGDERGKNLVAVVLQVSLHVDGVVAYVSDLVGPN